MGLINENAQILKEIWREGHWETQEKTGFQFNSQILMTSAVEN